MKRSLCIHLVYPTLGNYLGSPLQSVTSRGFVASQSLAYIPLGVMASQYFWDHRLDASVRTIASALDPVCETTEPKTEEQMTHWNSLAKGSFLIPFEVRNWSASLSSSVAILKAVPAHQCMRVHHRTTNTCGFINRTTRTCGFNDRSTRLPPGTVPQNREVLVNTEPSLHTGRYHG